MGGGGHTSRDEKAGTNANWCARVGGMERPAHHWSFRMSRQMAPAKSSSSGGGKARVDKRVSQFGIQRGRACGDVVMRRRDEMSRWGVVRWNDG